MSVLEIVTLIAIGLLLIGWYLSYTAARLHRLQTRVEGALAALDAQLVRRAESAIELANSGSLDPATSLILADTASGAVEAADDTLTSLDWEEGALADREAVESDLTRALVLALGASPPGVELPPGPGPRVDPGIAADATRRVRDAHQRVQLARRFYNDAVVDVVRVRHKLVVRVFRLAGHAQLPRTVEFDDELGDGGR